MTDTTSQATEQVPAGTVATLEYQVETLTENLAQLELSRDDAGWMALTQQGERDMSPQGVKDRARFHRVLKAGNPLAKRGAQVRAAMVFGDGLGFTADDETVNEVIQEHVDDTTNRRVVFGATALERNENALYTDGNVFLACPTDTATGKVTHRHIPIDEIADILTAPGDRETVQFFVRRWSETDREGRTLTHRVAYPHLRHMPATKHRRITTGPNESTPVDWNTPVLHVPANRDTGQKWGIADLLSVVPWVQMYRDFLTDWSRLMKSLSAVAWQVTTSNGKRAQQARAEAARMDQMPAGSTAATGGDTRLESVSKSGATIDADSAKPLASMISAGLGLPVITLLTDPGQAGARATAETLSEPTRQIMRARQSLWQEEMRALLEYVLLQSVLAPQGKLKGRAIRSGDTLTPVLSDGASIHPRIDFPSLESHDIDTLITALSKVREMDLAPHEVLLREALRALGVPQVDEVVAQMLDDDGRFIPPSATAGQAAGDAAADAARRGEDPSAYL